MNDLPIFVDTKYEGTNKVLTHIELGCAVVEGKAKVCLYFTPKSKK